METWSHQSDPESEEYLTIDFVTITPKSVPQSSEFSGLRRLFSCQEEDAWEM